MESTLQWLAEQQTEMQKTLQSFQESHQVERQALLVWQTEQQKALQDFIKEQSTVQQQLLQRLVSPAVGDGTWTPGLSLCKMAPADDPDAFLGTFEQVALGAGWDRITWALRLGPYLTGEAQAAYMALMETQARDYDAVKAAILDCLGLSAEKYRQKLRAARWTGRVQPRAFAQKLTYWATRWLRPDAHTVG